MTDDPVSTSGMGHPVLHHRAQAKRQRKDSAGRTKEGGQGTGRTSWPAGKALTAQQAFSDSAAASENVHWQVRLCVASVLRHWVCYTTSVLPHCL